MNGFTITPFYTVGQLDIITLNKTSWTFCNAKVHSLVPIATSNNLTFSVCCSFYRLNKHARISALVKGTYMIYTCIQMCALTIQLARPLPPPERRNIWIRKVPSIAILAIGCDVMSKYRQHIGGWKDTLQSRLA